MNDYEPSKRVTFMYFAYGSNLWTNRLRLQNPSAIRKTTAVLKVCKVFPLKFGTKHFHWPLMIFISVVGISTRFLSAAKWANHLEWFISNNHRRRRSRCMGCRLGNWLDAHVIVRLVCTLLSTISCWHSPKKLKKICRQLIFFLSSFFFSSQEGVHINKYFPLIKEVHTSDGDVIECRMYQMADMPLNKIKLKDPNIPYERKPSKTYITTIIKGAVESKLPEKYVEFLKKIVHNEREAHAELIEKLNLNT